MKQDFYQNARADLVQVPGTLSTGVVPSTWLDMSDYDKVVFVLAIGATDNTVDAKVRQDTQSDGASGNAKDVSGAAITQLSGTDDNKFVTIQVSADQLDIKNGFRYVALSLTIAGATTGTVMALRYPARHLPVTQPSAYAEAVAV